MKKDNKYARKNKSGEKPFETAKPRAGAISARKTKTAEPAFKNQARPAKKSSREAYEPRLTKNSFREEPAPSNDNFVYGRNAVLALLKTERAVDKLFVQHGQREGSITKVVAQAVRLGIPVIEVSRQKLDTMTNGGVHQGVLACAAEREYCSPEELLEYAHKRGEKPLIIIADRINDPHNLGALIRSAECAGAHGIVIPKRNAAGISGTVVKSSAGAALHMPIAKVSNIGSTIDYFKKQGLWVFIASASEGTGEKYREKEQTYDEADFSLPCALVFGNEGEGSGALIKSKSDFLIQIPMSGKTGSLNVSCAAAVIMFEAARKRKERNEREVT